MSLENQLKQALRRVEPETDLAAGVLARLEADAASAGVAPARRPSSARSPALWTLAASVLVVVGAGLLVQQERSHARSEAAARQLAYALELTSRELENVHQHLERKTEEKGS